MLCEQSGELQRKQIYNNAESSSPQFRPPAHAKTNSIMPAEVSSLTDCDAATGGTIV